MDGKFFDKIVRARANDRVQERICTFRRECLDAYYKLYPSSRGYNYNEHSLYYGDSLRAVFKILSSDNVKKGWPKYLWEEEEERVTQELLSLMDGMQNAILLAEKAKPGENEPADR